MRIVLMLLLALSTLSLVTMATGFQQDRLEGRWEGSVQGPQGEQRAVATFKKSADGYTGTITGRGDTEMPFRQIKVEGNKITALADVQGTITINYSFQLENEMLKGTGQVDFGGQTYKFEYDLKRASDTQAQSGPAPTQQQQPQRPQRPTVPQPQQKQSLDYFVGQWTFQWVGRESPLGPGGSVDGTRSFVAVPDAPFLECRTEWKTGGTPLTETSLIAFDEEKKVFSLYERRSNGIELFSLADWSSPIIIRFTTAPIKLKGQVLRLKRSLTPISAHSFKITEELSEDGGPFTRLGNGVFSKVLPAGANK